VTTGGRELLQQATHAELLQSAAPAPVDRAGHGLDAIIVPASRPAENLKSAIDLALRARCHLVLLCSRDANVSDVVLLLKELGIGQDRATVVDVLTDYEHDLFRFETTRWIRSSLGRQARATRSSDLSLKRNIGLALTHMLGWQRIFFMDDDIRDVTADALAALTGLLGANGPAGPYRTAGMTVKEFPDNSVVCHARRDVKKDQDVFVSGSVLAVDCTVPFGFFPDIYNEDWLFFYDDAAAKRLASPGFNARQLPYDPYANSHRAASEEFGDLIAEGLFSLLHAGLGLQAATREYWSQFRNDRMRIIDNIIGHLHIAPGEIQAEMAHALTTARRTLTDIQPGMCVDYIRLWREDLRHWEKRLQDLPQQGSIADALRELGLSPADLAL
jgi:hypothetical protein